MTIHKRIRDSRLAMGLSQAELAKRTGVSQPTVANWENGGHIPRHGAIKKISSALSLNEIWLLSGEENRSGDRAAYLSLPLQHVAVRNWQGDLATTLAVSAHRFIPFASQSTHLIGVEHPANGNGERSIQIYDLEKTSPSLSNEDIASDDIAAHLCATIIMHSE